MELSFIIVIIFWLHSKLQSADLKINLDLTPKCALEAPRVMPVKLAPRL